MSGCTRLNYIKESRLFMYILNNSDILFRFCRFLCVNAYFGHQYIIFFCLFQITVNKKRVNKTEKKCGIFLRTIKICRFEIIDGVKYVYCIKHAYKFVLREQVGFAAVL